ncbi:hypothetical protein CC2G_007549 [Coprinopsis cinerea AmutBmut pab1-1]|nr:hypothetical protein CC2G_007549 [Coprinopsis cinerea AmutBmut pab1-1]
MACSFGFCALTTMSDSVERESYLIGGIEVEVFRAGTARSGAISVLFLLHGRGGFKGVLDTLARDLVLKGSDDGRLFVVTLDHRNHGKRLLDEKVNNDWSEIPSNPRHAIDMFTIQVGTAKDVSFLIDFLPSYLSPDGALTVEKWGVAGISLGGHSTWISLAREKRVQVGIPIIGCPDYLALMRHRTANNGIPFAPPYFPPSLLKAIEEYDPATSSKAKEGNPFIGKKILVISGGDDKLVPWAASQEFVDSVEVGESGIKKVVVYEGVGHQCTEEMEGELCAFVKSVLA